MKNLFTPYLGFFVLLFFNWSCTPENFELNEGDILFQDLDCGPLCDAIEEVTRGVNGAHLSHIGLVVKVNNTWQVVEAISPSVCLTPLDAFLSRSLDKNNNPKVLVGRVLPNYADLVVTVKEIALKTIGIPYDDAFLMQNGKLYCSEMIYELFYSANNAQPFFELQKMTFKPNNDSLFFPAWINYYNELKMPIPEAALGINPGGVSKSDKIAIVHHYGLPDHYILK